MVKLYKRGRIWWVQINLCGRQGRRSLRTISRSTAEALCRHIELDVLSGGKLTDKTWRDFSREFESAVSINLRPNTSRYYIFVLDKLSAFFDRRGLVFVSEITTADIVAFLEERQRELHPSRKRAMTDGGRRGYLRVLHRIFATAVQREYIRKNPVAIPNRNAIGGRTKPFCQEEITAMLTSPYLTDKPYLRAVVLLFLHSGLRIGDVIHLQKRDLDGAHIFLRARKNNQMVRLPIHSELREALNFHLEHQQQAEKASPYVFATDTGKPIVSLDKHLRRLWKACGVTGGHAHRFRDTFAVSLLEKGASLYDVAKMLGISVGVVEAHYSPYVKELQERGRRLLSQLNFTSAVLTDPLTTVSSQERDDAKKVWRN